MEFNHPVGDYHVHPDFSIDARGSLREYCDRAIELGLAEMIFTTHVDSNPAFAKYNVIVIDGQNRPVDSDSLKRYRDAVYDLIEGNNPVPLMIRCGIELEYFPGVKDSFYRLVEEMHFDFVLCGIHYVDDRNLCEEQHVRELLEKYSPEEIIEQYCRQIEKAAEYEIFDSLAHLDLYRRIGMKLFPEEAACVEHECLERVLEKLAQTGLPIEINTSGIRHGIGDWYPSRPLLDRARRAGVLIGGLGSDSHAPEHLALDFEVAHLLVHESFPQLYED